MMGEGPCCDVAHSCIKIEIMGKCIQSSTNHLNGSLSLGSSLQDTKLCTILTKYSLLPVEEGLHNNQLVTATRASKGTRREGCPEDILAMSQLGCGSINKGIHYTVSIIRLNNSEIIRLSRCELYNASKFIFFPTSLSINLNSIPQMSPP